MSEKKAVLFIDSGDTLVDESTEIRPDETGIVAEAGLTEGAKETLLLLKEQGYRIALVADGLDRSFENIYRRHGLRDVFDAWTVSETVGCDKPSGKMFQTALDALGLTDSDKPMIVMAGNNLTRDIVGANRFGIHSCLVSWSPRYRMTPETPEETPEFVISDIRMLPEVLNKVEQNFSNRQKK